MDYFQKYQKYKQKYLQLKDKITGGARKLDIHFGIVTHQTIGECVKELIDASYNIYVKLLSKGIPITIVCGGQSPAYYCLAMMNFPIFNPELVNIVILPHSKDGVKTKGIDKYHENVEYCHRLQKKNIQLNNNVVIIDGVHSGVGILALESALKYCFPSINVYKIAINADRGIAEIPVDEEIILPCEPKFSDTFPRLVTSFYPRDFNDISKFNTSFINLDDNPIASMIIDIAKNYPEIQVEETDWYKLNNEITEEIARKKEEHARREEERVRREEEELRREEEERVRREKGGTFIPIVLTNPKRYQCPICKYTTGTAAPLNPKDTSLFSHSKECENKYKIPIEET